MPVYDAAIRRDVAAFARRYFAGTITLDTFVEYTASSEDPLIQALRDALVHEPPRGGFLGLRDRWWRSRFWKPVEALLDELDKGSAGQVPAERVYPRITLWGLVLGGAFLLWAGLFAARFLDQLLIDVYRGPSLPFWNALGRVMVVAILATVTAVGLEGWIHRLQLYRTRRLPTDGRTRPPASS
ncbi:MAG TPA: hypothetical protein VHC97_27435 [Thermoanaerobaculia bacterium]|jgi:hypothetical protein|nr:hypothetical protein [Thermoanaerobaculia bacterium]